MTVTTAIQEKIFGPKVIGDGSGRNITATVQYDDRYKNGFNNFSIVGDIYDGSNAYSTCGSYDSMHDLIAKCFPMLAPLIKFHGFDPRFYLQDAVFFAGERDYNGLLKGEKRHATERGYTRHATERGHRNNFIWVFARIDVDGNEVFGEVPSEVISETRPTEVYRYGYVPHYVVGQGKVRQLDLARSAACWPDASDEDLIAPGLEERLLARHPGLMAEYKAGIESLGFVF